MLASLYLAWLFARHEWEFSFFLALEKLVEASACIATLAFTFNALWTGANDVDMLIASCLRLAIFVPSTAISWVLIIRMKRLRRAKEVHVAGEKVADLAGSQPLDEFIDQMLSELAVLRKEHNRNQQQEATHGYPNIHG